MSTGSAAPYHFTQPSTDYDVQIVSPTATMAIMSCSLNVTIPSSMFVLWRHNDSLVNLRPPNNATKTGNTATLLIGNLLPLDVGVYQCRFYNPTIGWILRRNIRLLITGVFVHMVLHSYNYIYALNTISTR